MNKDEEEIDLKQDLYDDDMGFVPAEEELLEEPQVMTGLDGYTLEDDPDGNNMVDEKSFFAEDSQEEELDFDSLSKGEM